MRSVKIVLAVVAALACIAFVKSVTTAPGSVASSDRTAPMAVLDLSNDAAAVLPIVEADPAY